MGYCEVVEEGGRKEQEGVINDPCACQTHWKS